MGKRWNLIRKGWGVQFVPRVSEAKARAIKAEITAAPEIRRRVEYDTAYAINGAARIVAKVPEHESAELLMAWEHWRQAYRHLIEARKHAAAALTLATRPEISPGYVAHAPTDPALEELTTQACVFMLSTCTMLKEDHDEDPDVGVQA